MAYQINPGWIYKIDKPRVIDPSGIESEVEFRSIDVLRAIESGCQGIGAIIAFMERHSPITFIESLDPVDRLLSREDMMKARIEECLDELIKKGIVSP